MSSCFLLGWIYGTTTLVLALAGALLVGTSVYMMEVFPQYGTEIDLTTFSTVAIVIGTVTLLMALLMTVAVCVKHRCMLYLVALISALVFCLQLGASLWLFAQENTGRIAGVSLKAYTKDPQYIDNVQSAFECCGKDGPTDWAASTWGEETENEGKVPVSCCASTDVTQCKLEDDVFKAGCESLLFHYMAMFYNIVLIACLVVVVNQFATVFLSCCVARAFKDREYEELHE